MKPRNKHERSIVKLSKKLPKITETQMKWALDNLPLKFVTFKYNKHVCLECNHRWKDNISQTKIFGDVVCPNCKAKLKVVNDFEGYTTNTERFNIFTTNNGYQVVRMFVVITKYRASKKPHNIISEVMQHWINESGKMTSLGKLTGGSGYYLDDWKITSYLEVRSRSHGFLNRVNMYSENIYPRQSILPIIKRNGYRKYLDRILAVNSNLLHHRWLNTQNLQKGWDRSRYLSTQLYH